MIEAVALSLTSPNSSSSFLDRFRVCSSTTTVLDFFANSPSCFSLRTSAASSSLLVPPAPLTLVSRSTVFAADKELNNKSRTSIEH